MFGIYDHPAIIYVCRHCGQDAGYDPELCFRCGPLCGECWAAEVYPCDPRQNDFRPVDEGEKEERC